MLLQPRRVALSHTTEARDNISSFEGWTAIDRSPLFQGREQQAAAHPPRVRLEDRIARFKVCGVTKLARDILVRFVAKDVKEGPDVPRALHRELRAASLGQAVRP